MAHIFLVEPNIGKRIDAHHILVGAGHDVHTPVGILAAIEGMNQVGFDTVLLPLQFSNFSDSSRMTPRQTGFDFSKVIAELAKERKRQILIIPTDFDPSFNEYVKSLTGENEYLKVGEPLNLEETHYLASEFALRIEGNKGDLEKEN